MMYSKLQDGSFMVCGYTPKDAETRTTQSGKKYVTWSVKVGEKPQQGGTKEALWTSCKAWGKAAELAGGIRKGDVVFCIGRLETYESNGKTYKNLVCEFIDVMGAKMGDVPPSASEAVSAEDDLSEFEEILNDGEVPF